MCDTYVLDVQLDMVVNIVVDIMHGHRDVGQLSRSESKDAVVETVGAEQ